MADAAVINTIEGFKEKLFKAAREKGFADYELYYVKGSSFSVDIFEGEVKEYTNAGESGLSFRGTWKGKMGYAFSERLGDDVIPFLLDNAAGNAEIIEDPDLEELFAGSPAYPGVKTWDEGLAMVPAADKIATALSLEKAAKERDPRVQSVDYCQLTTGEGERYIANSRGLHLAEKSNGAGMYAFARVQGEDGQVKMGGDSWQGKDLAAYDAAALGRRAADIALSCLGAESVPTGQYRVTFSRDAMEALLGTFAGVFSAESVQKGFSLLKGKTGEKIAGDCVSIRDDPLLDQKPGSAGFDSEGVAAKNKAVVENGVLKTYLHNRKTARKDGVEPTGNGFKASFKASLGISPTNFYIVPSEKTLEALLAEMGGGLIITGLEGLHSGANPVSGDFSLSAEGFLVEAGKKGRAVEQIVVAGNFFTLLKDILAVGNDARFESRVSSPCVYVRQLSVAGQSA
ncbi:MAG: TldD/PmbA family protein [Treponema sp.]|jgi:PmbA protein|nr:TldD/PmbA family protein [Treponema sp.]